jgi:hypothetical protein
MRGLRRGIGLYINEVSSPSYRREVQRLASKGKLAVVVSDDSLAFGVNMPFRTCVFAGEMGGELTPLMAQQMSGRAGRRGLDERVLQCNLLLCYFMIEQYILPILSSFSGLFSFLSAHGFLISFTPITFSFASYFFFFSRSHSICSFTLLLH